MSREYEVVCQSFPRDGCHLDARLLSVAYTGPLHVSTVALEGGQYCLPIALYGQGVVLTLRVET